MEIPFKLLASASDLHTGRQATTQQVNSEAVGPRTMTYSIITNKAAIEELRPRITDLLNQTGQAAEVTLALEYFLERNELRSAPRWCPGLS